MTSGGREAENRTVCIAEKYPCQRCDRLAVAVLCFVSLGLYLLTFSAMPTSDGLTEASRIETGDPVGLYRAVKLLYQPMGHMLYQLCQSIGFDISPIHLLQIMNALVGSIVIAGFFLLLLRLFGDRLASLIGAAILACSHSVWFYLNCEVHIFSVASLLAGAWVLLTRDLKRPATWILAGVAHGLATLFHVDNITFGGVVLMLIINPRLKIDRVKAAAVYICSALVVVLVPYYLAGRVLSQGTSPWLHWYHVFLREVVHYKNFNIAGSWSSAFYSLFQLVKGQGTALTIGGDVLTDLVRNHQVYMFNLHLVSLLVLTAGTVALLGVVLVKALRQRRNLWRAFRHLIIFSVAWLVSLQIVHYFWTPSEEEYHITTLPPLIILLVMTLLTQKQGEWRMRRGSAIVGLCLASSVFLTNLFGIVLPHRRFGESVLSTAGQVQEFSQEDALFITPDSSVNLDYFAGREVRTWEPDLFLGLDHGLETLEATVDTALAEEREVFLFRWLWPSEFFFYDYNRLHQASLTPDDFAETFTEWATERYILVPTLYYWEWQTRYDVYGNHNAVMYRVEPLDGGNSP